MGKIQMDNMIFDARDKPYPRSPKQGGAIFQPRFDLPRIDQERVTRQRLGMTMEEYDIDSHLRSRIPETDDKDDASPSNLPNEVEPESNPKEAARFMRNCFEFETQLCKNKFREILDHKDVAAVTKLLAEKPSKALFFDSLCRREQEVWLRSKGPAGIENPRRLGRVPRPYPQYRLNCRQPWQNAPPEVMKSIKAYINASPVTPDAIRAAIWACRRDFLPILTVEGFLKAAEAFTDDPSLAQLYKAKNREALETWLREKGFIKTPPPPPPPRAASKRPAERENDAGAEADDEGVVARKRTKV